MTKAYSYIRFSTPEQSKGNSFLRQTEAATRYAQEHGLILDETVTYLDAGVSGFSGENAETGMLAAFKEAVRKGVIERGSYLIVENLDRLSRQTARKAVRTLEDICEEGISVVTLSDGKVYTADSLDKDPVSFLLSILIFMRAHEESATKSKRGLDNWRRKREAAMKAKKPITKRVPAWLKLSADRCEICQIDDRVAIVQELFRRHLEGVGAHALAAMLNERGVECWGDGKRKARQWHNTYIRKILTNSAVIGEYTPYTLIERNKPLKEQTPLPAIQNYYPAIISEEVFYQVQEMHQGHKLRGKKLSQEVKSVFARLATCPYCGEMMTRTNKGKQWVYLVCTTAKARKKCHYHAIPYFKAEQVLLDGIFKVIPRDTEKSKKILSQIESVKLEITKIETEVSNLLDAIKAGTRNQNEVLVDLEFTDAEGYKQKYLRRLIDQITIQEEEKSRLEGRIIELKTRLHFSDSSRVAGKVTALQDAIKSHQIESINRCLHDLLTKVVIDYDDERLVLHFKHTSSKGVIPLIGFKSATCVSPDDEAFDIPNVEISDFSSVQH